MNARFPHLPHESWDAFLDERLGPEAEARIDAHLDQCPACVATLEQVDPSRIFRRLRGLTVRPEMTADLWSGIAAELQPRPQSRRAPPQFALALGAAAALILAVLVLLKTTAPDGQFQASGDPCATPRLAALQVTPDECRALFAAGWNAPSELVINASLDLRGL